MEQELSERAEKLSNQIVSFASILALLGKHYLAILPTQSDYLLHQVLILYFYFYFFNLIYLKPLLFLNTGNSYSSH